MCRDFKFRGNDASKTLGMWAMGIAGDVVLKCKPAGLLSSLFRYSTVDGFARDATLLAQLKADFGARPLNHSCAATAPAAQRQGRRVRIAPPAQDRPLGRGKGAGFGRHSGIGAHSQPWTTR